VGIVSLGILLLSFSALVFAQASSAVPMLVNFSGALTDANHHPQTGVRGVTFLLYKDAEGGAPLWMETQNVTPDKGGHYTVTLGATKPDGLPANVFASGEARWLAVQVAGEAEQARVLLVAVPYAMKAADAETIGGLPPSAFVLAAPPTGGASPSSNAGTNAAAGTSSTPSNVTTSGGTVNTLPLWNTATDIESSVVTQTGSGGTAKIGIGTATPATTLDVKGTGTFRGLLTLPATGTATATGGKGSQAEDFVASSFSSATSAAVNQTFQWKAEAAGNNTATPSGTLNLLFGAGAATPAETGLKINSSGILTFAAGQTFPGGGGGSVTSVGLTAPTGDFKVTGSPVTGAGTLALAWKVAPTSNDTANAIVKRDTNGNFSGGLISAGAVVGVSSVPSGPVVSGDNLATSSVSYGVVGSSVSSTSSSSAVLGADTNSNPSGYTIGVTGTTTNPVGIGVVGRSSSGFSNEGSDVGAITAGVWGDMPEVSRFAAGVIGTSDSGTGVIASSFSGVGADVGSIQSTALSAFNEATGAPSVENATLVAENGTTTPEYVLYAEGMSSTTYVRTDNSGRLVATGTITGAAKLSQIDHPVDPANKFLIHTSIESPDMKNLYDGVAMLDGNGEAWVELPNYFEALNQDFRYQLTAIGAPGPGLYIAEEISGNRFRIAGGKPGAKVSWQVTGIRHDAWAMANRSAVEVEKTEKEKGRYLHPQAFGQPLEKSITYRARVSRHKALGKGSAQKLPNLETVAAAPASALSR